VVLLKTCSLMITHGFLWSSHHGFHGQTDQEFG